jgi:regulator of sigma E protease
LIASALFIVLVFVLLILPHEIGHYLMAKVCGMKVERFSFGLGPRLWGFRRGETEYSISALPFGGYVKIAGMEPGAEVPEGSFRKKPLSRRVLVLGAGSGANYLVAIILLALTFMIGFYTFNFEEAIIGEVIQGSPAASSNLLPGDRIIQVGNDPIDNWENLALSIKNSEEEILKFKVQRNGEIFDVKVSPNFYPEAGRKMVGIAPVRVFKREGPIISLAKGAEEVFVLTKTILLALWGMITGRIPVQFSGPVGIAQFVGESVKMGPSSFILLTALLSVNLGLFNLFPIPALDGGRILFLALEGIRGKPLDLQKEEMVHYIGFLVLISLILLVTYQDILRLAIRD